MIVRSGTSSSFVFLFSLVERKNETQKTVSTLLWRIPSLPMSNLKDCSTELETYWFEAFGYERTEQG